MCEEESTAYPPLATIAVEWRYERHQITLTARNWAKVKRSNL